MNLIEWATTLTAASPRPTGYQLVELINELGERLKMYEATGKWAPVGVAIDFLRHDVERVKRNFEQVIRDPDIDFHYRWERFREAPEYLKNHDSFVPSFINIDDICDRWERRETITAVDFIDHLYELYNDGDGTTPDGVKKINDAKECFMLNNLGSFMYDW